MKSVFLNRGKWLVGLLALIFSTVTLADNHGLDPTWVKEGVEWKQYTKFRVKPLALDDVKIVRPPWAEDDPKDWSFQSNDPSTVQAIFRDAMKAQLEGNDGWPVVHNRSGDVLEIEVEILSIMPYVRPGKETSDGYQLMTMGSGELTARVEFRDSSTRELLLLIEGEGVVGDEYKEFNYTNNLANLEKMFSGFAKRIRGAMDRVHGK